MNREILAAQVNVRRIARGKEMLRLAHIQRVMRYLFGPEKSPAWDRGSPVKRSIDAAWDGGNRRSGWPHTPSSHDVLVELQRQVDEEFAQRKAVSA